MKKPFQKRNHLLTIQDVRESGSETEDERSGYYAQDRSYGPFIHSIPLPGPVDELNVKAE